MDANRDLRAVSLSSPIMVEWGSRSVGRVPIGRGRSGRVRRGTISCDETEVGSGASPPEVGAEGAAEEVVSEAGVLDRGCKTGTVELALIEIRPVTYPTSLSSNCTEYRERVIRT